MSLLGVRLHVTNSSLVGLKVHLVSTKNALVLFREQNTKINLQLVDQYFFNSVYQLKLQFFLAIPEADLLELEHLVFPFGIEASRCPLSAKI